jgi:hypothetical protein
VNAGSTASRPEIAPNAKITAYLTVYGNLINYKSIQKSMRSKSKRLLDIIRDKLRLKNYSHCTEITFSDWNKQYIVFINPALLDFHRFLRVRYSLGMRDFGIMLARKR